MKKRVLLSMALLSAVVMAGSTSLTSYAAGTGTALNLSGKCYKVYIGQACGSLSQILEEIGAILGNNGNFCPDGEKPGTGTPEAPEPETPAPETPAPEAPAPEAPAPEAPEPETPTPEAPAPETPAPEAPAPETPAPPIVETPGTQEPDADTPDESVLSYAQQVVKLVNEEREKAGLPALTMQKDITAAANVRAREIKQSFSHTRPNGSSFSTALKEQGVAFRGSGENIAWGQKTPEQVMNGWMNSEGHRANILNKNFKNIGVGYYQDERGVNHWVQLFTY